MRSKPGLLTLVLIVGLISLFFLFPGLLVFVGYDKPKITFPADKYSHTDAGTGAVLKIGSSSASYYMIIKRTNSEKDKVFTNFTIKYTDSFESVNVAKGTIDNKLISSAFWNHNGNTGGSCKIQYGLNPSDCCSANGFEKGVINPVLSDGSDYYQCYSLSPRTPSLVSANIAGVLIPLSAPSTSLGGLRNTVTSTLSYSSGDVSSIINAYCIFGFNFLNDTCSVPVTVTNAASDGSGVFVDASYSLMDAPSNTVFVNNTVVQNQTIIVYINSSTEPVVVPAVENNNNVSVWTFIIVIVIISVAYFVYSRYKKK